MNYKFYQPNDDTYIFIQVLQDEHLFISQIKPKVIVEIGCGSGIISNYLKTTYKDAMIIANDVNYDALLNTQLIAKNEVLKSSLLQNIKQKYVDLLVFNPPYVETPEEDVGYEDIRASYSGGLHGSTVIKQFINEIEDVQIFYLLIIKVNEPEIIVEQIRKKSYDANIIFCKKIMGETIYIIRAAKI